jgi:glycosyltransferase involved in cell wall biosynthesis
MPRVIQILNRLIVGGPLLQVAYLTHYMAPEFDSLLVFGQKDHHEKDAIDVIEKMGIPHVYLPEMRRSINPFRDYIAYKKLKQIITDFKPDIVHTHAAKAGSLGRLAAIACKVPVIIHTYHGHIFHSYFGKVKSNIYIRIERYLGKKTDALIAISGQQKEELEVDFKIAPAHKFHVVLLGLDFKEFKDDEMTKRKKFRNEFGVKDDEIAIGIIGRLAPIKNHGLFLEAIAFVQKNTKKKIKAFIIGDGEARHELEAKAKDLDIKFSKKSDKSNLTSLVFTSWRNDIDVVYAGLDIVALTSFNEGTPVSLIEAQAAGKAIVSTRVGGIQDVVIEGETALLSNVNNDMEFFKKLLQIVEDDEFRKYLGRNGLEFVIDKFSYHRLINDMKNLYDALLFKKIKTKSESAFLL